MCGTCPGAHMHSMGSTGKDAGPPSLQDRMLLAAFTADLRTLGPANFLYAKGDVR